MCVWKSLSLQRLSFGDGFGDGLFALVRACCSTRGDANARIVTGFTKLYRAVKQNSVENGNGSRGQVNHRLLELTLQNCRNF